MKTAWGDSDGTRRGHPLSEPHADGPGKTELGSDRDVWRIHLLEDDPSALASTADLLENAGFSVTASSNLMDAIDYVARSRPNVLILSLELPAVSIVRLFRDLGSLSPGTRVILTSVRSDWGAFEEAHLYGASSLVTKPIHPMSLLRAVERAMAGARGTAG